MRTGLLFGVFFFGLLLPWTVPALHRHGGLPWIPSLGAFGLLIAYLALFPAVFGFLVSRLARRGIPIALWAAPFAWTTLEWIRSHLFTGFPWGAIGYTQYRIPALIQFSSVAGIHGISCLVVAVNALLAGSLFSAGSRRLLLAGSAIGLPLVVGIGGGLVMGEPTKGILRVGAIQGNVVQEEKWEPHLRERILERHLRMTRKALKEGVDLVVWPESALPVALREEPPGTPRIAPEPPGEASPRRRLEQALEGSGVGLLVGAVEYREEGGGWVSTNAAQYLSPEGIWEPPYAKVHLVPFVEYVPWRSVFFFLDRLAQGTIADFLPGTGPVLHEVEGASFATAICYEMIFPHLIRNYCRAGADFIVNITNDGWFDRTGAPYQHFAMGVFRAVENRRWVVRAANTGVSGFIDPFGRIRARTEIFRPEIVVLGIQPRRDPTLYQRVGDLFSGLCAIITIGLFAMAVLPGRPSHRRFFLRPERRRTRE